MSALVGFLALACMLVGAIRIVRFVLTSASSLARALARRIGRALFAWGNR